MPPHDNADRAIRIPLGTRNHPDVFALIDPEDADIVCWLTWKQKRQKNLTTYAQATVRGFDSLVTLMMHRVVMGLLPGDPDVDHINGNGLDNRKTNLRICTDSQNQANRKKLPSSSSRFRGVTWHKQAKQWQASIKVNRKYVYLGLFHSEVDAAVAYNNAAVEHFGEFASLNTFREEAAA